MKSAFTYLRMKPPYLLHIIAAVHNRYEITERFVDNLKSQSFQCFRLILVDDGSTDGTDLMVKGKLPNCVVLHGSGSLWWGGALHKAYKYLKKAPVCLDDYVLIINDDTTIENGFLETGVNLLDDNPDTFIPALGYSINDGRLLDGSVYWDFKTGDNWILEPDASGNCASTRALFFRVKDFLKVGGFHPILLPHYGSDYEFGIRAWRKGYKIRTFSCLKYAFNEKTTGDRAYAKYSAKDFIKKLFRKRSSFNPVYKLSLLVLVTPLLLLPKVLCWQACKVASNLKKGFSTQRDHH
jgi:GT2 family glycosyltransferase